MSRARCSAGTLRWGGAVAAALLGAAVARADAGRGEGLAAAPGAGIPFKRGDEHGARAGAIVTLAVIAVVAAGALALARRAGWLARQRPGGSSRGWRAWAATAAGERPLIHLQALRLTPRASLHLVRWRDRDLLVACSEAGVTVVDGAGVAAVPAAGVTAGPPPAEGAR